MTFLNQGRGADIPTPLSPPSPRPKKYSTFKSANDPPASDSDQTLFKLTYEKNPFRSTANYR